MFLLRRTAARALSSTPSKAISAKPRTITTCSPIAFRLRQQPCISLYLQRRFASDGTVKEEKPLEPTETENFAQTAAEAPLDDAVAPVPEAPQAEPTDSSATVGNEGLDTLTSQAASESRPPADAAQNPFTRPNAPQPNNTVYVGNLFYEVTEAQLKRVFSRFGPIEDVSIVNDNRGLSRGFGYVKFESLADATAAVENLDMQVFEGRNLVVQYHRVRPGRRGSPRPLGQSANPSSKTLFIGNMSFEMSDKDLTDLFKDIRNVMDVRVAIDRRTGQPRGFAHADFVDVASAVKARETLQDKVIYGRKLRIDYSVSGSAQQRESAARKQREAMSADQVE